MAEVLHLTREAMTLLAAAKAADKARERDPAQEVEWSRAARAMRDKAAVALRKIQT